MIFIKAIPAFPSSPTTGSDNLSSIRRSFTKAKLHLVSTKRGSQNSKETACKAKLTPSFPVTLESARLAAFSMIGDSLASIPTTSSHSQPKLAILTSFRASVPAIATIKQFRDRMTLSAGLMFPRTLMFLQSSTSSSPISTVTNGESMEPVILSNLILPLAGSRLTSWIHPLAVSIALLQPVVLDNAKSAVSLPLMTFRTGAFYGWA